MNKFSDSQAFAPYLPREALKSGEKQRAILLSTSSGFRYTL